MPLHPEIAAIIASLPEHAPGPIDPSVLRAGEEAMVPPLEERLPLHDVEDVTAETRAGDVPVRIYTPVEADAYGVLVYFHGGAFFLGSLDTHDHVARALAKETGHKVISVGFRRAPEAAFPAGLEDCYGVVRWVAESGERLGWDGQTLAIAGDSSGGTFVAAVAAMAHDDGFDRISHQVLFYPSLDLDFDADRYASLRENAVGYGLETGGLAPFNAFYIDSGADPADPRVSPIKREDLTGLPPALILTAEFDPLRDEGELYGERLRAAGVNATVSRYAGANHGFVQNFSWIPEYYRAFDETATFLNQHRVNRPRPGRPSER
jgi:acetyl esterase